MSTAPGKAPPKNLDVLGIDRVPAIGCNKGFPAELSCVTHLSSLGAHAAQPDQQQKHRRHYRSGGTRYITVAQATNIIEAVERAKPIGLSLVGHVTIHWSLTDAGDDPEGTLFAKFREGLSKWWHRRGILFAAAWARESHQARHPRQP